MDEETVAQKMGIPVPETLEQAVRERDGWIESAAMFHRNEEYYRGLLIQAAAHLGVDVRTDDTGQVHDEPFVSKVPELVAAMTCKHGAVT